MGNCVADAPSRDDIGKISQFELSVDNFTPWLLVQGKVFEGDTTLHNVDPPDKVKVTMEIVQVLVDALVSMPTNEVTTMPQTF